MKILKSIKWRLQLWYGLILVVVLAGFGGTAYQLERNRQFSHIDQELHRRVGVLANALRRPPPRRLEQGFFRPPPDQMSDDAPPMQQGNRPPPEFRLAPENVHLFGTNDPNGFYFHITMVVENNRKEIARSDNYRDLVEPAAVTPYDHFFDQINHADQPPEKLPAMLKTMDYHEERMTADFLPSGEFIEVGCSIAPELKELHRTALNLTAIGGLILLVGLAGGWWFVGRALRPVSEISATAAKISAGDLSQRINVAEAESELGQLAAVLNSTFARLETAFAQQKQFASDAAHELRTPVSVILTQTQTALNRERDAASYKQTVEACQRAAQRMRKLIESLLELARFDAGQEVLKQLRFNFSKTISDSVEMVQALAEERNVKIVSEIAPLELTGDSARLAQVVTNLLTNAIQYNQPGGEVRLKLAAQNGLAVLEIADTGQGIAPENLPRVFERFYRADQSRTGAGNAGLGLSICKAIVEAHGGTIEVASGKNRGTTFTVRLPLA
jgi:heavy metal sensor kinase